MGCFFVITLIKVDFILTRNNKDCRRAKIKIVSPADNTTSK